MGVVCGVRDERVWSWVDFMMTIEAVVVHCGMVGRGCRRESERG